MKNLLDFLLVKKYILISTVDWNHTVRTIAGGETLFKGQSKAIDKCICII